MLPYNMKTLCSYASRVFSFIKQRVFMLGTKNFQEFTYVTATVAACKNACFANVIVVNVYFVCGMLCTCLYKFPVSQVYLHLDHN